jgi:dipeptidyl aminopeptidase/acylaminoacyl peptidase
MKKFLSLFAVGVLASVPLVLPFAQRASAATGSYYDWVSRDYNGAELNSDAGEIRQGVSSDGRYVVFTSAATDVVPNDTNGYTDLFMRDRQTDTTTRISVSSTGQEANNDSFGGLDAAVSGDGRYVVFQSRASNLVSGDTNNQDDVFLRDTQAGTTTRICGDYAFGCGGPAISRDGRYVTYTMSNPFSYGNVGQLFRYDITTGDRQIVSYTDQNGAGNQFTPPGSHLSSDGRYVVFNSYANNLVAGDTNNKLDIFRRDMQTGDIVLVSTDSSGVQANGDSQWPTVSDDGRYVEFTTTASNFATNDPTNWDLFVKDTTQGTLQLVGGKLNNAQFAVITGDGTQVVFETPTSMTSSDTNSVRDVYSWNRTTGVNTRFSDFLDKPAYQGYDAAFGGTSIDGKYTGLSTVAPLDPSDTQNRDIYIHAIDTVRPTVTFTAPASFAGPFPTGPTVTVTASDSDSGLKTLVIHVYTSTNQLLNICGTATPAQLAAGTMSCDLSSLPNGTYYIKAGAFDVAGNNRTINSGNFVIGQ